jgi:hypothetical protein
MDEEREIDRIGMSTMHGFPPTCRCLRVSPRVAHDISIVYGVQGRVGRATIDKESLGGERERER